MICCFALRDQNFLKNKLLHGLKGSKMANDRYNYLMLRFREECPDGKLSRLHLKNLFQQVFPEGKVI